MRGAMAAERDAFELFQRDHESNNAVNNRSSPAAVFQVYIARSYRDVVVSGSFSDPLPACQ